MELKNIPIIHPEYYLGRRGPKQARQVVKEALDVIKNPNSIISKQLLGMYLAPHAGDPDALSNLMAQPVFWKEVIKNRKIYVVGQKFTDALTKLDKDIPFEIIPTEFNCYVSMVTQKSLLFDFDGEAAFVKGMYIQTQHDVDNQVIYFTAVAHPDGTLPSGEKVISPFGAPYQFEVDVSTGRVLSKDLMKKIKEEEKENTSQFIRLVNFVINFSAYVNSGEPDVTALKPSKNLNKNQKKRLDSAGQYYSDEITVPVELVSWGWMKPKKGSWVETFLRWQRYGKGLTKVKLIWVKAHSRGGGEPPEEDQ